MNVKNFQFPRLLVFGINAWADTNSMGNTVSNHFGGWDKDKLSNVYLRDEEIDNSCCENYFRICEKDILKSLFTAKKMGVAHSKSIKERTVQSGSVSKKTQLLHFIIRRRPTFVLLLRELFWKFGFIKRGELDRFLSNSHPELIHAHCPNLIYGHRVLHYIQRKTNAKLVLFFGDEIYSHKSIAPFSFMYQLLLRYWVRKTIRNSSLNYAATNELCEYYTELFGVEFKLLYKGAEINPPRENKSINRPIRIVYAGNLLYERWNTLALVTEALTKINSKEMRMVLDIYSTTPLSTKMFKVLNTNYSRVHNALPFEQIKEILSKSDVVLHVESFSYRVQRIVKYSFSTKIVDCIQSGSCILAIGPSDLASIGFLSQSDAAIVINDAEFIYDELSKICLDNSIILNKANCMYKYAKDTFKIDYIRSSLYCDMNSLL